MSEHRAIVILYNGEELPEYLISRMIEPMVHNGIATAENITMKVFDSEALANLGINNIVVKEDQKAPEPGYAFEQAVIYLANRFQRALNKEDLSTFTVELTMEVGLCANVFEDKVFIDDDNPLVNAVKIVATTTLTRRLNNIANKHKLPIAAIRIIRTIWKPYQNQ